MPKQREPWILLTDAAAEYGMGYFHLHKLYRSGAIRGREANGNHRARGMVSGSHGPAAGTQVR